MKKLTFTIVGVLLAFFLIGCSKMDPVALVKGSTLDIDKSVTIGNAFDNYKYFKSVVWDAGQDEQKRQIVTFKGIYDPNKFAGSLYLINLELTPEKIAKALQANPGLEYSFVVQFKLAVDGKSFEVGFSGIHVSENENGKPSETEQQDENNQELQAVYQNQPSPTVVGSLGIAGS
jgi:hypothetical protein